MENSEASEMYLTIQDNFFNQRKAEILTEALKTSGIKNLVFFNSTQGFDVKDRNFTYFGEYMKPLKQVVKNSDISWSTQVVWL